MIPLGMLEKGAQAVVAEIVKGRRHHPDHAGHSYHAHRERHGFDGDYLERLGIRPGAKIEVVENDLRGPLIVRVGDKRMAIGRGISMKVLARRE